MIQSDLFLDHLQNMSDVFQICRRKLKTISHSDWRTALMTQVCGGRSCMCWRYCSCIKAPEGLLSYPSLSLSGSLFSNSHLSITCAPSHVSTNTWEEEEEPAIAHAALEMPQQDCRIVVLFFFFQFFAYLFLGAYVCMWGQMDTFMSAWVWIILQATSGAPHGTANCGERGRWACWRAPLRWALSNPFNGASAQMAEQKVRSQSGKNKCLSQSAQLWSSSSVVKAMTHQCQRRVCVAALLD